MTNISCQQIVDPSRIEPELIALWEALAKQNKTRASLFNLVVFNRLSPRTDYIRSIVQKVVSQFPCRILFISSDPDSPHPYLKTAISVVTPQGIDTDIACDQIDIGVGGAELERVPFLLLPHLIPDLPTYLLWTEDPSKPHPLFAPLSALATRIIFDSESADDLLAFANTLLQLNQKTGIDIADLNWARTEGWRDLIASLFDSPERLTTLSHLTHITLTYNARETPFFCHLKIQAIYLFAWLSSRLPFPLQPNIQSTTWEKLGPGTVIAVSLLSSDQYVFEASRLPDQYHQVKINISSSAKCELPYHFLLGKAATGQSLVKEICTKGTSTHYLEMLKQLQTLNWKTV